MAIKRIVRKPLRRSEELSGSIEEEKELIRTTEIEHDIAEKEEIEMLRLPSVRLFDKKVEEEKDIEENSISTVVEVIDALEDIKLINNEIYHKRTRIGKAIIVKELKRSLDVGEIMLVVKFEYNGAETVHEIPRVQCLNKKGILSLMAMGADVDESNSAIYIKIIKYQEEKLGTFKNTHRSIGYSKFQNKEIFKLNNGIGIDSDYIGALDLKPNGSLGEYIKNIIQYVTPYANTTMAWLIGCTSAIVGKLRLNGVDLENLLVHAYGESSTGKSTATILAISVWGNPSLNKQGLYNTWNATENALINSIGNNNGVACAFDELSMSKVQNFTQLIYNITAGRDKTRLTKDIEQREIATWATTIISNGEASIRSQANKNTGLDVRILELGNIKWTESAIHSEKIKEIFKENYGTFGMSFAEKLIKFDIGKLKSLFKKEKELFKSKVESLGYTDNKLDRTSSKYALITLAGALINSGYKDFDVDIRVDEIRDILVQIEISNIQARGVEKSAEEWLLQIVSENSSKFIDKKEKVNESINYWGTIEQLGGEKIEVAIAKGRFEELLKKGNFEDKNVILNEWKSKGMLSCEKDRYTRKRKINKVNVPVYVVTLTE